MVIRPLNEKSFSLLTIIVNRGKGSKILKFACEKGACEASCLLGKGTIKSKMLQAMEMNDVDKEIILMVIPTNREIEILNELNRKYKFERKNHGIAFTTPLKAVMRKGTLVSLDDSSSLINPQLDYVAILIIVDKGKAKRVVEISQDEGFYGGTIIKARGSASSLNVVLDMIVEPEKEAVLMLMESRNADHLAALLTQQLKLDQPNMGILVKIGVSNTIGLFQNDKQEVGLYE